MLLHNFVSAKPDGADTSKLRPSDWNAEHVFSGGSIGNVLVRDTGVSNGASWTATPSLTGLSLGDGTSDAPSSAYASEPTLGWYRHEAGKSFLRNKADQDMYLGLRSGDTAEQRAYVCFANRDGLNEWLIGKNAATKFILYENDSAVHRMNLYPSGTTELNSVGTNAVRINFLEQDRTADLGTGGLEVWTGGLTATPTVTMNASTGISLYQNYDGLGNYDRAYMRWQSNTLIIGTDKGGTGTLRPVGILASGTTAVTWGASTMSLSRSLVFATDNTFDIGASLATRPKNLFLSGGITHGSATLLTTTTALTNGAAAAAGTLTNAPTAGNPTKWVPINDNGTTRYIPAW